MNAIVAKISAEPVLVTSLVQSVITLAITFGAHLTVEQVGAILVVTNSLLAIFARGKVTPT